VVTRGVERSRISVGGSDQMLGLPLPPSDLVVSRWLGNRPFLIGRGFQLPATFSRRPGSWSNVSTSVNRVLPCKTELSSSGREGSTLDIDFAASTVLDILWPSAHTRSEFKQGTTDFLGPLLPNCVQYMFLARKEGTLSIHRTTISFLGASFIPMTVAQQQ